jgi:AcrR family transcriptional regulator
MAALSTPNRTEAGKPQVRAALIEAAARLIATEGPRALTLRRVADEVGTSTMAIYTHFGGMPELRHALRRDGYARVAAAGADVGQTDDPVYDVAMLGRVYQEVALTEPHLYRVMFMEQPLDEVDAEIGSDTRETLTRAMQRCIDAGRFDPADADLLAREYWAFGHGIMALLSVGLFSPKDAFRCTVDGGVRLFIGWGDDPDAARASLARAVPAR